MSRSAKQRCGSATILMCVAILVMVTATAAITMRGLATQRFNRLQADSQQLLRAAVMATDQLPTELLETGIRLPINESQHRYAVVSLQPLGIPHRSIIAVEEIDGKQTQSIQILYLENRP